MLKTWLDSNCDTLQELAFILAGLNSSKSARGKSLQCRMLPLFARYRRSRYGNEQLEHSFQKGEFKPPYHYVTSFCGTGWTGATFERDLQQVISKGGALPRKKISRSISGKRRMNAGHFGYGTAFLNLDLKKSPRSYSGALRLVQKSD
jgi:hypothetical protein